MSRRRADLQQLDIAHWPSVDYSALAGRARESYLKRQLAVELYAKGESVRSIVKQTGVEMRQLYRLLQRCLAVHDDTRLFGYRGLLPRQRVRDYVRRKQVNTLDPRGSRGTAGAFGMLLERHPGLQTWLKHQIRDRRVFLEQVSTCNRTGAQDRCARSARARRYNTPGTTRGDRA